MIKPEQFINIADTISKSSKCTRAKVGAVIVKDNRIISTGYNGKPSGWKDDCREGCEGCKYTVHAEVNAITFAAKNGVSTCGSDIYVTLSPCSNCALLIIQAGIDRVYFKELYKSKSSDGIEGIKILLESYVKVYQLNDSGSWYRWFLYEDGNMKLEKGWL